MPKRESKPVDSSKPVDFLPSINAVYQFTLDDSGKLKVTCNDATVKDALQNVCNVCNDLNNILPTLSKSIIKTASMIACRKDWTIVNALNKAIDNGIVKTRIASYVINAAVLLLFGTVIKAQSDAEKKTYKATYVLDSSLESIKTDAMSRLSIPQETWTKAKKRYDEQLKNMAGWTLDVRTKKNVKTTKAKPVTVDIDSSHVSANGMDKPGETIKDSVTAQVNAKPDATSSIASRQETINKILNLVTAYLETDKESIPFAELKKALSFIDKGIAFTVKEN